MEKKPEYEMVTSINEGILEIILNGEVAVHAVNKMVHEIYEVLHNVNPEKLLVDLRSINWQPKYTETYFRVRDYPSSFHGIKHAIVDCPERRDHSTFHEYVAARVMGLSVKWFTDIEMARSWLNEEVN